MIAGKRRLFFVFGPLFDSGAAQVIQLLCPVMQVLQKPSR